MKDYELIANAERTSEISDHLCFLYFLVHQLPKSPVVLELGVGRGESTKALLQAVGERSGLMNSIDTEPCEEVTEWAKDYGSIWQFWQGDDLLYHFNFPFDLILLDTSHTYEQTKKELEKFVPMVVRGGYFVMHDTNHKLYKDDINRAVDEYFKNRVGFTFYRFYHNNGLLVIKVG